VHIHVEPLGGLAGDMFVAALADAFPHLRDEAAGMLAAQDFPAELRIAFAPHDDGVLHGHRLRIDAPAYGHGSYPELDHLLATARVDETVRSLARRGLRLLGEAEAGVHGVALERVHFHEIAGWDTLVDLLLAAFLAVRSGATSWSVAPLPLGGGRVQTQHGLLPVPAPATAAILRGFRFVDDGIAGERVTPTGAAILAALAPAFDVPPGALTATGHGFGTRQLPGISNCTRVMVFDTDHAAVAGSVAVLAFEIDDQSAEDLATGIDRLRSDTDVLDIVTWPVLAKKGRLATHVQVLARAPAARRVADRCFAETTTLGVRVTDTMRVTLPRESTTVDVGGQAVRVKVATRPDGAPGAKPEMDDLAPAGNRDARERLRAAALDVARKHTP
jgi:uncharacterized protein (TIGR00299 family) protein